MGAFSMAATLRDRADRQKKHDYLYWEFYEQGGKTAVVRDDWKAVRRNVLKNPQAPTELYDLTKDLGEQSDVAGQHPELIAEMERIMRQEHTEDGS